MSEFIVCVRKRPCFGDKDVVTTTPTSVSVKSEKVKVNLDKYTEVKTFDFEKVYSDKDNTQQIYSENILKHTELESNFICYTFGETGSGKTHTLFGPKGLIDSALFDLTNNYSSTAVASYEIYADQIYDLLNGKAKLTMLEANNAITISGLTWRTCKYDTTSTILNTIKKNRLVGVSSENSQSSRSHCIVHIKAKSASKNLNYIFVDLAGSERSIKSNYSNRRNHYEMAGINTDIFHLKECIRYMKENNNSNRNNARVPFRASKLTMALRESFYDKYSGLMVVTISPEKSNTIETLNILACANTIKSIKRKPRVEMLDPDINISPAVAMPAILPTILPAARPPTSKQSSKPIASKINKNNNVKEVLMLPKIPIEMAPSKKQLQEESKNLPQILNNKKRRVSDDFKLYNKLLDTALRSTNTCTEYVKLPNNKKEETVDEFGQKMANILTDQVSVLRVIDKKFGRKFFALS